MEKRPIEEEIKKSYMEYAMSVIISRALPDARDGLKPVQRRILYAMNELNLTHDKPYKKSARIIGETMGKYHPHGDTAIYDTLARMAQDFSLRYLLIDGQGNFGSIDGDLPAAMRYTEARMKELSEEMMQDIEKETVPYRLNFDGSLEEPEYFPSKVPQLLINGGSGIAVGMATSLVPHNLTEVCDAIKYEVDHADSSVDDLLKFVKAPDFPGGGVVFYNQNLIDAYKTGKGKAICHGEVDLSEDKRIIITSLPYAVNKALFIQNVAENVKNEILKGITDIRDESDREGMRVVIKVRDNDMRNLVLNQLYEHTALETSIGITNLVLVNNEPKVLNLKEMIDIFIDHRLDIILKRTTFDLNKFREREHILLGLNTAIENLDPVIELIRSSKDASIAKNRLMETFSLSEIQAGAILDIRLQRLTSLEIEKVRDELQSVRTKITDFEKIVEQEPLRRKILKKDMDELKKKYGDKRRTNISFKELEERSLEDLIPREESVLILSEGGLIKRVSLEEYKAQRRGGKGIITSTRKEDSIKNIVTCTSHDQIYFFTNTGRVLRTKAYEIEKKSRKSVGTVAQAFLPLSEGEVIKQIMKAPEKKGGYLYLFTRRGYVKKTKSEQLFDMRVSGLKIITLEEDDEVISVEHSQKPMKMLVVSSSGKAASFSTSEVRATGRTSRGVKSIRLKDKESVISAFLVNNEGYILNVTERGLGKRTKISEFPVHHRGSGGVYLFKERDKTGNMVKAIPVSEEQDILIVTKNEKTIRLKVKDIRILSRHTSGVKLIGLDADDKVIDVTPIES